MQRWQDYFTVIEVTSSSDDDVLFTMNGVRYNLVDRDGNVVAVYRDHRYAVKQAKYRYKKLSKKLEKILLR